MQIFLVGAKLDLKKSHSCITKNQGEDMAKKIKAYGYYETSSMTGYGITELFDEFSKSTLHLSVSLLEMKILYHLNKIDGQINGKDEQGNTALHLAAKGTNPEIVKCLISLGASRTEMNNEGKTPSEIANVNRNERNLEVRNLLDNSNKEILNPVEHFLSASSQGQYDLVKFFMSTGFNSSVKDNEGNTALHKAAEHGHEECVKLLLMKDFRNLYTVNSAGDTPLSMALKSKNNNILQFFLMKIQVYSMENKIEFQSTEFQDFVGSDENMFHLRSTRIMNDKNSSLLKYILKNNPMTLGEREILIDLLAQIDKDRYPDDSKNSEYRVIETLKAGIPTSKPYSECIESAQGRFPWTSGKMWAKRIEAFILDILLGIGVYFIDVFTDYQFSSEMFENSRTNFTEEFENCSKKGKSQINYVTHFCQDDYGSEECFEALHTASKDYCFKNLQVFESSSEWHNAFIVSGAHCITPLAFSVFVYLVLLGSKSCKSLLQFNSCILCPLPFLTKVKKFWIDWKNYGVFTLMRDKDEYTTKRDKYDTKEEKNENKVNTSLVIEASLESSFQFVFQTTFILPTIIMNFTNVNGTSDLSDLVDWKLASIIISFGTFAFTTYKIRYYL